MSLVKHMSLGKQAKVLTEKQVKMMVSYLGERRNGLRNQVVFMLSSKSGLRSKEISCLKWNMIVDPHGDVSDSIHLTNDASKGNSGRIIPLNKDLRNSLVELLEMESQRRWFDLSSSFVIRTERSESTSFVIRTERSESTSPQCIVNMFQGWYRDLGYVGCSSHSGRRSFVTNTARKISLVGGSLRDVQMMVGHKNLQTTQRYIDYNTDCQRKVVDLV